MAEEAFDEARLGRALREIDRRLVLQRHPGDVPGGWVYKVICIVSDTLAPVVFTWADDYGNPLPLSSGLIDEFNKQRREVRERLRIPDADEHNEQRQRRLDRVNTANRDEILAEHRARLDRSQTQVSFSDAGKPGIGNGRVRPRSGVKR